jgi:hypothetical protein
VIFVQQVEVEWGLKAEKKGATVVSIGECGGKLGHLLLEIEDKKPGDYQNHQ